MTDDPPGAIPLLAAEPAPNIEADLQQQLLLTKVDNVLTWAAAPPSGPPCSASPAAPSR